MEVSEPLVGECIDTRYELRRVVARGGMGLVYEAHHRFTRRAVAIKLLPVELRAMEEARDRLLREAHALTAVRHPGVVEVLDAGVCARHGPYLVLEMLDGRTLDGILAARRSLPIDDTVQVGRQMCDAVAHAHARGVVHRDLKPSNVFVARNEIGQENVKLIDYGVAAVGQEQLAHHDRKLTTAHEVLGTPEYMAPEQLMGRATDARTDVYAIGMTLFECLTGEVPYSGTYPEVLVKVTHATEAPSVRARRPDVPDVLASVIETAIEKQAEARWPSAAKLGRALMAASGLAPARSSLLAGEAPGPPHEEETTFKLVKRKSPRSDASTPAKSAPYARHFVRVPYLTPVLLASHAGELPARSEDISEEGMLVVAPLSLPIGTAVRLQFAAPGTGAIVDVDASVRWLREGRGRSAIGVEFSSVPDSLRAAVAGYVAQASVTSARSSG